MEKIFLSVLNMSLTASFVIITVIFVRLFLKKAPKIISYALWAVVGFRLVFPFTFNSMFSLLPFKATPIPQDIGMQAVPRIDTGVAIIDNAISGSLPAAIPTASINPLQIWISIGSYIWLLGIAVMLIYSIVSVISLKCRLSSATLIESNLHEADNLKTPFVIGFLNPKIYIPTGLSGEERHYIILHEQIHIKRLDHIVKMFAYFVLCLHWFNPLAWMAFVLMVADMEMSCDERVIRELGGNIKNAYSLSLVRVAAGHKILNGSPLAFGEGGMKERIKNILNFRKPSPLISIFAVVLVVVITLGLAVSRGINEINYDIPHITATETIFGSNAQLLPFGYSWYDGKDGVIVDAIQTWKGKYTDENTLVLDEQDMIALSAENPITASYIIYLPDGTVYDDGTRTVYDSLSPRLFWTDDKKSIGLIAPFELGTYIYEVTIGWEKNDLKVTYGLKVVVAETENGKAYDKALSIVWEHNKYPLTATSFKGFEILPDAEYAGDCYVFEVESPDGIEKVAVSKEQGIYFTFSDNTWWAFTGLSEYDNEDQKQITLDDIKAIAEKIGPDLTLEDLRYFKGEDVGSGRYIMQYWTEEHLLVVIANSLTEKVLSANLIHAVEGGVNESIDIRYYDVNKFIIDETKELVRELPPDMKE